MKNKRLNIIILLVFLFAIACNQTNKQEEVIAISEIEIFPKFVTDSTPNDTDDPAIWYNKQEPAKSLILGTDKGDSTGGIFVFNLKGKIDTNLSITNLQRPNNVDLSYGFDLDGKITDIAVFTERGKDMIRVISVPDFKFIDNGGIPVFENDSIKSPMGIALYNDENNNFYAIVSRKFGPSEDYLHQYLLSVENGAVVGKLVRKFGKFSGNKEIEAIAVNSIKGYVYYSDEGLGVRKYYASPQKSNEELALFAQTGFADDHEGISIYKKGDNNPIVIVSDQQANKFQIFKNICSQKVPHEYQLIRTVKTQTTESDGSELCAKYLNDDFPNGIFVAMSDDKTFHYYKLEDVVGE